MHPDQERMDRGSFYPSRSRSFVSQEAKQSLCYSFSFDSFAAGAEVKESFDLSHFDLSVVYFVFFSIPSELLSEILL